MKPKYSFFNLKRQFADKPYPDDVNEHIEKIVVAAGFPKGELVKARLEKAYGKIHFCDRNDPTRSMIVNLQKGVVDNLHRYQMIDYEDGKYVLVEKPEMNKTTTFKKPKEE